MLTGAGGAFCAGGDVKAMAEEATLPPARPFDARVQRQRTSHRETSGRLHRMPKPTIAALPGAAAGAGLALALACDLRYAAEGAVLTTAFARVGLRRRLRRHVVPDPARRPAKARELYFFSERLDAAQALELGLLNGVVAPDALEDEVLDRARRLATGPRIALAYMKENLNRALTVPLEEPRPRGHPPPAHGDDGGPPRGGAGLRREARAAVPRA